MTAPRPRPGMVTSWQQLIVPFLLGVAAWLVIVAVWRWIT